MIWWLWFFFVLCSTYFYVSIKFTFGIDTICHMLDSPLYVSTLVIDFMVVTRLYYAYSIIFMGLQTRWDLVILNMLDFDIIIGMTWLSLYHAILNCNANTVTIEILRMDKLKWEGVHRSLHVKIISLFKLRN